MSIELRNLAKNYNQAQSKIDVLKGINQKITAGEVAAIVGSSGSGKSTLLSLLAGLDKANSGEILVDGQNICEFSENEMTEFRAQNIGIVFQQYHLVMHLTALENVMLPLEIAKTDNAESKARDMLKMMGLESRTSHLPKQMSGGECQRVALARALVVSPKLLLADEPTGNLDPETGKSVMDVFFSNVKKLNTTTILVTHSMELAKRCDRILVLKSGLLLEN